MLLEVADVGEDGVVDVFESEFLILQIDACLEQDLLLLVEVLHDVDELVDARRESFCALADRPILRALLPVFQLARDVFIFLVV